MSGGAVAAEAYSPLSSVERNTSQHSSCLAPFFLAFQDVGQDKSQAVNLYVYKYIRASWLYLMRTCSS